MFKRFTDRFFGTRITDPRPAYDLWAGGYDNQPDNLMLVLDEAVFSQLLDEVSVKNKVIADIGCGTGRHWRKLLAGEPLHLEGYDVSEGMLHVLKQKFPEGVAYLLTDVGLDKTEDISVDIIISTLTIAHIENIRIALGEWNRVLKPGGHIIITDYHPGALKKGGKRTFSSNNRTVSIRNYIHTIEEITGIAGQLHWQRVRLVEKVIDESVKPFYEKQQALDVYESFKGVPIIYGLLLKKTDATE